MATQKPRHFKTEGLPTSLNIHFRNRYDDPKPEGRYGGPGSDTTHTVGRSTPIYTDQEAYDPKTVMHYIKSGQSHSTENDTARPLLQQAGGQLWHYDGLHRIIASRLSRTENFQTDVSWDKS